MTELDLKCGFGGPFIINNLLSRILKRFKKRRHEPKGFTVVMTALQLDRSPHPHISFFTGFRLNKIYKIYTI